MEFINQIVVEGVVIEPVSITKGKKGVRTSTTIWHKSRNSEMLIRVTSRIPSFNKGITDLERGSIVTFFGEIHFLINENTSLRPFPVLLADRMRVLDVDLDYGRSLLEKANLEGVNKLNKVLLPWEKDND